MPVWDILCKCKWQVRLSIITGTKEEQFQFNGHVKNHHSSWKKYHTGHAHVPTKVTSKPAKLWQMSRIWWNPPSLVFSQMADLDQWNQVWSVCWRNHFSTTKTHNLWQRHASSKNEREFTKLFKFNYETTNQIKPWSLQVSWNFSNCRWEVWKKKKKKLSVNLIFTSASQILVGPYYLGSSHSLGTRKISEGFLCTHAKHI